MQTIYPLFTALPLAAAFFNLLVTKINKKAADYIAFLVTAALAVMAVLTIFEPPFAYRVGGFPAPWGILLVSDGLSSLMLVIINVIALPLDHLLDQVHDDVHGEAEVLLALPPHAHGDERRRHHGGPLQHLRVPRDRLDRLLRARRVRMRARGARGVVQVSHPRRAWRARRSSSASRSSTR